MHLLSILSHTQRASKSWKTSGSSGHSHFNCDCMEYWTCILGWATLISFWPDATPHCYRGGTPHSYCGLTDHDVCCFVPDNASPVGILPTPNRVKCGRKGFDAGKEGEAEMAEWPWHVGSIIYLYVCKIFSFSGSHIGEAPRPICLWLNSDRWVMDSHGSSLRGWLVRWFFFESSSKNINVFHV